MNTSKSNSIKIRVRDLFSENISSRDAIALLFNRKFDPEQQIYIDFSDVAFITRSATHQLVKEIERVEERFKCTVILESISDEVSKMLQIVKNSLIHSLKQNREVYQVSFNSDTELNYFLMQF